MANIAGISISTDEVSALAASLRAGNTKLYENLQTIKTRMSELAATWQSDAGGAIRGKFEANLPRFDTYRDIIEEYARFLDKTVTRYETDETTLANNANAFK